AVRRAQEGIRIGPEDQGPTPTPARVTQQGTVAGHGELGFDAPGAAEPGEMRAKEPGVGGDATEGESGEQHQARLGRDLLGDVARSTHGSRRADEGDTPPARHGRAYREAAVRMQ